MLFKQLILSAVILSTTLTGCGGGSNDAVQPPIFVEKTSNACTWQGTITNGNYSAINNLWGLRFYPTYNDYSACVSLTTTPTTPKYEFTWDWRNTPSAPGVKAYQEIYYNFKSRPIASLNNLSMTHDVTIVANGQYNVAYDLWLDSTSIYSAPQAVELMIWVVKSKEWEMGTPNEIVVFNGVEYGFFDRPGFYQDGSPQLQQGFAFVTTNPMLKGTIQVKPFIDFLIQKGKFPSTYLLNRIEFGSEQMSGKGNLIINNYSVDY